MNALGQYEVIGAVVVALGAIFALFKYFSDSSEKQNTVYTKFNENLVKCTLAIDNLNKYIERMEREVKDTLTDHEKRLDEHQEAIIKLNGFKDLTIRGKNDES